MKCLGEVFDFIKQAAETQGGVWAGRRPGKLCRRQVTMVAKCRMVRESTGLEAGMSSGIPWQGLELGMGVPVTGKVDRHIRGRPNMEREEERCH